MTIRDVTGEDAPALAAIYDHWVTTSIVSFEEEAIGPDGMSRRIAARSPELPWLVADEGGRTIGFAYAAPWKSRAAYRRSVEVSIYLAPDAKGGGRGTRLYSALLDRLRALDVHAAVGGIALPNDASVALHEKLGFEPVARFREIGRKLGRWIDVGYWEIVFDEPDDGE